MSTLEDVTDSSDRMRMKILQADMQEEFSISIASNIRLSSAWIPTQVNCPAEGVIEWGEKKLVSIKAPNLLTEFQALADAEDSHIAQFVGTYGALCLTPYLRVQPAESGRHGGIKLRYMEPTVAYREYAKYVRDILELAHANLTHATCDYTVLCRLWIREYVRPVGVNTDGQTAYAEKVLTVMTKSWEESPMASQAGLIARVLESWLQIKADFMTVGIQRNLPVTLSFGLGNRLKELFKNNPEILRSDHDERMDYNSVLLPIGVKLLASLSAEGHLVKCAHCGKPIARPGRKLRSDYNQFCNEECKRMDHNERRRVGKNVRAAALKAEKAKSQKLN